MKSAILVLVAVLAHQSSGFAIPDQSNIVSNVIGQLQGRIASWIQSAKHAGGLANNRIEDAFTAAEKANQEAREKANAIGAAAIPCIKDHLVNANAIKKDFVDSLQECVKESTQEIQQIGEDITQSIHKANDALQKVKDTCNGLHGMASVLCVIKNAEPIRKASAELASELGKAVLNFATLANNLQRKLELCIAKKVAAASVATAKLVAETSKCIADSIKNDDDSESDSESESQDEPDDSSDSSDAKSDSKSDSESDNNPDSKDTSEVDEVSLPETDDSSDATDSNTSENESKPSTESEDNNVSDDLEDMPEAVESPEAPAPAPVESTEAPAPAPAESTADESLFEDMPQAVEST